MLCAKNAGGASGGLMRKGGIFVGHYLTSVAWHPRFLQRIRKQTKQLRNAEGFLHLSGMCSMGIFKRLLFKPCFVNVFQGHSDGISGFHGYQYTLTPFKVPVKRLPI